MVPYLQVLLESWSASGGSSIIALMGSNALQATTSPASNMSWDREDDIKEMLPLQG